MNLGLEILIYLSLNTYKLLFHELVMSFFEEAATQTGIPLWILLVAFTWSILWKGIAWWKSARRGQVIWFIVFFFIHTLGILEILYIYLFSEIKLDDKKVKSKNKEKKIKRK